MLAGYARFIGAGCRLFVKSIYIYGLKWLIPYTVNLLYPYRNFHRLKYVGYRWFIDSTDLFCIFKFTSLPMFIYVYTCTNVYLCLHTYLPLFIYVYIHVYQCLFMFTYMSTIVYLCLHTYLPLFIYVYIHIYHCLFMFTYMSTSVYLGLYV